MGGELCLSSQGEAVEKASSLGWDLLVPKTVGSSWPQEVSRWVAKCSLRVSHELPGGWESSPIIHVHWQSWLKGSETKQVRPLPCTRPKEAKVFCRRRKAYCRAATRRQKQSSDLSPDGLLWGHFFVEVGSKMGRRLWNMWWKWRSFRNSVHRNDCPCLFTGGMCSIRIVPPVIHGRFFGERCTKLTINRFSPSMCRLKALLVTVSIPSLPGALQDKLRGRSLLIVLFLRYDPWVCTLQGKVSEGIGEPLNASS